MIHSDIRKRAVLPALFAAFALCAAASAAAREAPRVIAARHIALRGQPLYADGFTRFEYANPDAPKGGSLTLHDIGTFDNFHRYALRGNCSSGSEYFYDTLMAGSEDETNTLYPLVAESVEYADDYSFIIFTLNPAARDQEGVPLAADDAAFSFRVLFERGVPQFRAYYANTRATVLDRRRVRFDLEGGGDKEKMMSLARIAVFPRRFWEDGAGKPLRDFAEPLASPPLGTGPYRVGAYKMGQYVTLERVADYWAADLPARRGHFNFDRIRYDYYRDGNVAFEAFKAGEYDFREENSTVNWATGYTGKAFEDGRFVREEVPHHIAAPMQALVFNTERPLFADRRVRLALAYFFDFEWMNKGLFYGQYRRTRSYFQNTEYAAASLPDAAELRELEPVRGKVPPEVFSAEYNPPRTDGSGYLRPQAREGLRLLKEAGWELSGGTLRNARGEPFVFELLMHDSSTERFALPFRVALERYGITMRLRTADSSQFINRLRARDFDMIQRSIPAMQYPSSDLMILWHSAHVDSTWNTPGVRDGAVDYLCEQIAAAQEDAVRLRALGRALDRVLCWNAYVIPEWNSGVFRLAYRAVFGRPDRRPRYAVGLDTWWAL